MSEKHIVGLSHRDVVRVIISICVVLLGSCVKTDLPSPVIGVQASQPLPAIGHAGAQLLILSDTHAASPMAIHKLRSNSPDADTRVGAAMRPPQIEQWGLAILDWILRQKDRPAIVLHLGDATNISCRGELARFLGVMNGNVHNDKDTGYWYMTPGNHDTLVMGNWSYLAEDMPDPKSGIKPNPWNMECDHIEPSGSMDKRIFLKAYLKAQKWQEGTYESIDATFRCTDLSITNNDHAKARLCRGDEDKPYYWFIIQLIDIDDSTRLVLLDTTQYSRVPVGFDGALSPGGVLGGVSESQIKEIEKLLAVHPDKRIILAGHFPLDSLDRDSRVRMAGLISKYNVLTYLSGHIHAPTNARLHHESRGPLSFLELNFASVMGWPMEYGYLGVSMMDSFQARVEVNVMSAAYELYERCMTRWSQAIEMPNNSAFYKDYKKILNGKLIDNYDIVRDKMFANMFARIDSAILSKNNMTSIKYQNIELRTGARPRDILPNASASDLAEIDEYERCQAVWASEAEGELGADNKPAWYTTLPGVRSIISRYDDPTPRDAFFLRSSATARARWQWTVGARGR